MKNKNVLALAENAKRELHSRAIGTVQVSPGSFRRKMKFLHAYALFLMVIFLTSCKQNQTAVSKDSIKSETKGSITSQLPDGMEMVWDIRQDRNGKIWLASEVGVIRYDARLPVPDRPPVRHSRAGTGMTKSGRGRP